MNWLSQLLGSLLVWSVMEHTLAQDSPWCLGYSACGYIQKHRQGMAKIATCTCRHSQCPMEFNDEEQVFRGAHDLKEQYKFCGTPPMISKCTIPSKRVAFVNYLYLNPSGEPIAQKDEIRCECPESHSYEVSDVEKASNKNITLIVTKYACQKIPGCLENSIYEEITDLPDGKGRLVDPKCIASSYSSCPFRVFETNYQPDEVAFRYGKIHSIRCKQQNY